MIQAVHIQKTYDRHRTQANHVLRDVTLTLPDSGFICVLGPSGCGKTTLMNVIGGLDVFDSGRITIGDISAEKYGTRAMEAERNRRFGYVFQNYYLLPERSVAYNVYLGLHSLNLSRREKLQRVRAALLDVEMDGFAKRPVKDLSGGQQQRVAIARALARHPQVIFADEPTGNLDEINTDNICRLLRRLSYSCLVVMVTHEERIASQYSDRIIRLEQGKIVSDSPNIPTEGKEEGDYGDKGDYKDKGDRTETVGGELSGSRPVNAGEKKHDSGLRSAFGEAVRLLTAKGKHTAALWTCLAVLTAVVVLAVGDYLTVADIEPEDFIVTDSHVIDVEVMRGGISGASVSEGFQTYMNWLEEAGLEGIYLPVIGCSTSFAYDSFVQMDTLSENVISPLSSR